MTFDFADESSRQEERDRDQALERQRAVYRRAESQQKRGSVEPMDCIDCGEPIPLGRLELNLSTRRCTACASQVQRCG